MRLKHEDEQIVFDFKQKILEEAQIESEGNDPSKNLGEITRNTK